MSVEIVWFQRKRQSCVLVEHTSRIYRKVCENKRSAESTERVLKASTVTTNGDSTESQMETKLKRLRSAMSLLRLCSPLISPIGSSNTLRNFQIRSTDRRASKWLLCDSESEIQIFECNNVL